MGQAPDVLAPGAAAGGIDAARSLGHMASLRSPRTGSPRAPVPGRRAAHQVPEGPATSPVQFILRCEPQSGPFLLRTSTDAAAKCRLPCAAGRVRTWLGMDPTMLPPPHSTQGL
ncbi:hypothetical protein MC885_001478 [Smutsia gigantea]|nr:hypothetical protein MC885_001478 [Smutsia gigantea]